MRLLRVYPDQSQRHAEQALRLARALPHPPSLAHVLRLAGELHTMRRESNAAADLAADLLPLTVQHGSAVGMAHATMLRGWARITQRHITDGVEDVREGLRLWRLTGSKLDIPYRLGVAADALATAGHHDDAWHLLNEAIEASERFREHWFRAELHRMQGALLLCLRSDGEDAEVCFQQALTVARGQDARLLELRAASSLARLWRDQGRCADACGLLGLIYDWFTEGFATPDLQEAKTLLDELRAHK
jgi:predicted ATPase